MKITKYAAAAVLAAGMTLSAHALPITIGLGSPTERTATLSDATAGFGGEGNAGVPEINAGFAPLAPWTKRAEIARAEGASGSSTVGFLTVSLNAGDTWGNDKTIAGTWAIDASFWTLYADAAISMHVGNGSPDKKPGEVGLATPDHFVWHVADGATSGTFSYDGTCCNGGGLSNLKLYSSGTGTRVPDGGSTLALVGLAIAGLGLARRKLS